MKAGDLVRFKVKSKSFFSRSASWEVGLLLEYHKWEKIATVLYQDRIYRVSAHDVEKAGKKDEIR